MNDKTSDDRAQRAIPAMTGAVNLLDKLLSSDDIKTSHKASLRTVLAYITDVQQRAMQPAAAQEAVIEYQVHNVNGGWCKCEKRDYENGKAFEAVHGVNGRSLYRTLVVGDAAPVAAAPVDLHSAARFAADVLAELYAKYQRNIGPFASQAQLANVQLGAALRASTPAAPGIDPADPWRGLYAPELMPKLDGVDAYHVAHPDLPSWPKGEDEERGVSPLVKAQGFELEAVFGEYPEDDDEDPDYCAWLAQWQPAPPVGEHWRLVCIQDTEDGPAAFYVRPFALIDASPKGDDVQDGRFPGGLADAITYADAMEDAAADLYQHVLGYETDGSETGTDMLRTVLRELQASPKGGSDADLREALSDYLDVQDELDSWETAGPNRDIYESVMARRNSARRDLEAAMQAASAEVGA
ncbi:hypothetical protein ATCM_06630 [Stenotrophomonas sp. ATCM1_4]|uniref:hypothetical protein n=1 Tax=Stenotrophomonas sp. ATCM1_4 TaxID=2259330 RepID=UPI0010535F7E|nr:hypothetical protein [Stenotrophomonas sp. ATCM1_4]TDB27358.1 hypothetical protein ATCM_06630 [Stenotrophomonas sp. ATCM1_4]